MQINKIATFNRDIANFLSPILAKSFLKPNHITMASLVVGVFAGGSIAKGTHASFIMGALLLHISYILDNCDGQVARIKNMSSDWGRRLDYLADLCVDWALWIGLAIASIKQGSGPWVYWVAGIASLGSFINLWRVVKFRTKNPKPKAVIETTSMQAYSLMDFWVNLTDDGDPSLFVWCFALLGQAPLFLIAGCAYIYLLCCESAEGKK